MKPKSRLRSFLCIASSALLTITYSHAASGTWDTNANGNWTDPLNWVGNTDYASGTDFTATFGNFISADRIINLDAPITIGNITASDTTHNYTISGANILTMDVTSGVPLIDVTESGRTLTISSQIAGNDGLQKNGAGTLALSNASNNYTGITTITGGALVVNANALPGGIADTGGTSALTFNGGVLGLSDGNFTRSLGTAGTVTAANFTGNGGWAAYGANRTVNLGGASAQIVWATADTGFNGKTLILSNATATHSVDFQNGIDLGTAARTIQVDDGAGNIDAELSGVITGGAGGALTKTGGGALALSNASNNYTGITTITGGALVVNANALPGGIATTGGTSALTFNGGVLGLSDGNFTRSLGTAGTVTAANFTGNGGWAAYGADRTVNLGGAGAQITWATADTGFNGKSLILGATGATHTVTLVNDLDLGSSNRTVITGDGPALVDGILSGNITGTAGGLTKTGAGNLALSGTNTYSGKTTVGLAFPNPGQLIFQGKQAVSPNTTFQTGQNSGSQSRLVFLDDSAGLISLNNSWTFVAENRQNTHANAHIFVGNNSTANGGNNASSTQTGSTIVLGGGFISAPSSTVAPGQEIINITGANGYKLQLASLAFPNLTSKAAATAYTMTMNPTTAPLIVAGGVTPFASGNTNCTPVLDLGGTATGNEIQGVIADPSNVGTSNPLSLTKSNTSIWTLTNTANTYTGTTTISGGTLQVPTLANGLSNSSIGASANVAGNLILNGGTLQYTGGAQSTDRLFSLQVSSSLDASGTGAVNFTDIGSMGFNGGTAAKTLTLTGTNAGNNTLAAAIGNNTGATSISKTGIGTWVLSGVNSATGTTSLSGGGTLVLDYTGGDTSRLPSGVLNLGAGNLTLKGGTASNTQAVASTSITPQSVNTGNTVISRDGGSSKIALGAIARTGTNGNGGTISIAEDNLATTTSANFNGILSGAITIDSNYVKNVSGNIVALSGISAGNYANLTAAATSSTENYQLTGTLTRAGADMNSLRIVSDGDDQFLDLGANQNLRAGLSAGFNASGGILYAGGGNNNYTIKGTGTSTLQMQNGNQEVIINVYTGTLNVETRVGNGTGVFTKTGAGTLVLKGASLYTGRTHVNQGTLLANNTTGNGTGTGAVTVNNGAALGGTGTVGGSTTIAAGGGLTFDLTTASGSHDKLELAATNTLTFSGTSTLTITSSGGTPATGTYTLLTAPGGISGSVPATVNLPVGWTADAPQIVGNDLQINITSTGGGGSPEIDVNQGGDIATGGSKSFGTVTIGSPTSLIFTINNTGTAALNLTGTPRVAVTGDADFTVTAQPAASVAGPGNTTFTVQFAPSASGARNAVLSIANNDTTGSEDPFIINISGTGQTPYEAWAFGGAFDADANGDGVKNGLAWLLGAADKNVSALNLLPKVSQSGGNLILDFTCLKVARRGSAVLKLQHSKDLGISDPFSSDEVTVPDVAGSAGITDLVTFTVPTVNANPNLVDLRATIPASAAAPGTTLFGRLQAVNP